MGRKKSSPPIKIIKATITTRCIHIFFAEELMIARKLNKIKAIPKNAGIQEVIDSD